jgi:hypothetical protein
MKRLASISMWLAAGFVIAAWVRPGEFGIGSRNVQAADSFEIERQQILDLISRYSYTWDGKDAEAFTALFQENATVSTYSAGTLSSTMRSNKERLARAHERFQLFTTQGIQTRHYQTNTILERLSDGTVRGDTLFQVAWQYASEPAPKLVHSGTYRDLFAKTFVGLEVHEPRDPHRSQVSSAHFRGCRLRHSSEPSQRSAILSSFNRGFRGSD